MSDRRLPPPLSLTNALTFAACAALLAGCSAISSPVEPSNVAPATQATVQPSMVVSSVPTSTASLSVEASTRPLPSETIVPSGTPIPSASSALEDAELLDLTAGDVHDASLATPDQFLTWQYGSTLAYPAGPIKQRHLELLDVATNTVTIVPGSEGSAFPFVIDFAGNTITWQTSWQRPSPGEDATPGGNGHPNHWQLMRYDFRSNQPIEIATGVNHWLTDDNYVHDPYASVDGDQIAYDIETPGPGMNAQIVVESISTGDVVRTIDVGGPVFDVELSDGDVTYVTGDIADPLWDSPNNPRMFVSSANGLTTELPYDEDDSSWDHFDEDGVSVSNNFTDPSSSHSTLTFTSQAGSKSLSVLDIRDLRHGDGLVVWTSDAGGNDGHSVGKQLSVYDTNSGRNALLDVDVRDSKTIWGVSGIDDGWLVWTTWDETFDSSFDPNLTAHAVRTSDVHTAFDALADGL